uniref:Uncharacterized protein n=1 Tax=Sphaerodactylus townsendi TaxID=933632 RepID=A0ACB8GAV2_9SAUR
MTITASPLDRGGTDQPGGHPEDASRGLTDAATGTSGPLTQLRIHRTKAHISRKPDCNHHPMRSLVNCQQLQPRWNLGLSAIQPQPIPSSQEGETTPPAPTMAGRLDAALRSLAVPKVPLNKADRTINAFY